MLHTTVCPVHCPAGIAAVAEVCDNLSSAHGVLMHANLAIHELVKEEEQHLLAEEQKALRRRRNSRKHPLMNRRCPLRSRRSLLRNTHCPLVKRWNILRNRMQ